MKGSPSQSRRRGQHLVRLAAGEGAEEDDAVALGDDADPLLALLGEDPAEDAALRVLLRLPLLCDERRLLLQPDELRVAVREACAARPAPR